MLIYHLNLLLILGLAYPLCVRKPSRAKALAYVLVTFGVMLSLSAARKGIGHDYYAYLEEYAAIAQAPWTGLSGGVFEGGYVLLCKLLSVLGCDATAFYFVMAVLCLAPVAWFIYRYSPEVWLSVWLYVTLTFFYGTMNFIRQNLAVAVLLLGYPLLRKRKLWAAVCYIPVVLLAASFHKSAVVMLPVLLLCYLPLNQWASLGYALATLSLYLTSDYLLDFLLGTVFPRIPLLAKYAGYQGTNYLQRGFSPAFLILPGLILVVALLFRRRMAEKFPDAPILVNMLLINMVIWLFITKHFILERFSLNVYIYVLIALPMAADCLRPERALAENCVRIKRKLRDRHVRGGAHKSINARYQSLRDKLDTQKVLYGGMIAGILAATWAYHLFGMYDGGMNAQGRMGFHGVFPYQSILGWISQLP